MIPAIDANGTVLGQILSDGEHFVAHVDDHAEAVLVAHFDPLIGELHIKTLTEDITIVLSCTERSIDSPVVPHTKTPLMWFFTNSCATGSTLSRFSDRSSCIGVWTAQQRPSNTKELGSFAFL